MVGCAKPLIPGGGTEWDGTKRMQKLKGGIKVLISFSESDS